MNAQDYDAPRLRRLRRDRGFTQQEVADRLDLHRNTVLRAEEGMSVSFKTLKRLAELYGIQVKTLIL